MKEFIIKALYDTCTLGHIDTIKKSLNSVDFDSYDSIRKNLTDDEIDDICYAVEKCSLNVCFDCMADEYVVDEIISKLSDVRIPTLWDDDEEIIVTDTVAIPF